MSIIKAIIKPTKSKIRLVSLFFLLSLMAEVRKKMKKGPEIWRVTITKKNKKIQSFHFPF